MSICMGHQQEKLWDHTRRPQASEKLTIEKELSRNL